MNEQVALDVARNALVLALELGGPILLATLAVGTVVSVFQAVTQIQEQTLSFVPKMLCALGVMAVAGPWMGHAAVSYTAGLFSSLAEFAR